MKKKLALLLFLSVIIFVTAGCGSKISKQEKTPDEIKENTEKIKPTLVIGTDTDVNNLNLQDQQDQINNIVLKNTHQTLIFFNNGLKGEKRFEPCLANSWEFTDDTHLKIMIRKDVHFNDEDKTKMTADDVKFTLDMAMKSKVRDNLKGYMSSKVLDPYSLEIEIDKYNTEFIQSLATVPLSIQSKKAYKNGVKEPYLIGTGPYKVEKIDQGEYVKLKKVDDYWGNNIIEPENLKKGVSDFIEFKTYFDSSARAAALQSKEIDVCINPPINELNLLGQNKDIKIYEEPGTKLVYFGINVSKKPWNSRKLRQAVSCAIDRNRILQESVSGKGMLQTTILNRGLWSFYDEMSGFDYNISRAKTLMNQAGFKPGDISTSLTYPTTNKYEKIAQIIKENLEEIGIKVRLNPLESAKFKKECESGNQEMFLWRWNEDSKLDFVYRDLFYTGSSSNYFHLSDKNVDRIVDEIAGEKDIDRRRNTSEYLQNYLVYECVEVPLFVSNLVIAYDKDLRGEYFYSGGNHNWSHAYIVEE